MWQKKLYGVVRHTVIFIVCIFSAGWVIYSSVCHIRLAFCGIKTNATAVHVERSGRTRTVTFRFFNENGHVINVKDGILYAGWREVGDTVPIVYLPSQPEICVVQGMRGYTDLFIALFLFALGILSMLSLFFSDDEVKY